jgi:hypothetical protein
MNYSEKIPNNQLYLFIKDYIDSLIASNRKTKWFQLETELFNDFDKKQILNYLARDNDEHNFFEEQFEYINKNDLNWNKDNSIENPESCIELFRFTHLKKWENIGNLYGISI